MLKLIGILAGVFTSPKGVNRETGAEYGGQSKLQVMAENVLKNGEKKMELVNLTTDNPEIFKPFLNKPIELPVSAFVMNGGLLFTMPSDAKPRAPRSE